MGIIVCLCGCGAVWFLPDSLGSKWHCKTWVNWSQRSLHRILCSQGRTCCPTQHPGLVQAPWVKDLGLLCIQMTPASPIEWHQCHQSSLTQTCSPMERHSSQQVGLMQDCTWLVSHNDCTASASAKHTWGDPGVTWGDPAASHCCPPGRTAEATLEQAVFVGIRTCTGRLAHPMRILTGMGYGCSR